MATARMIIVKYFIFTFPSFLMQVAGKQLEYNGHQKQRFFAFSSYRELPGQSERQNSCLIGVSLKEGLELRLEIFQVVFRGLAPLFLGD